MHVYAYDTGRGMIEVIDRGTGDVGTVCASRIVKRPWKDNNRRTDYWFTWNGARFFGHCGEDRTGFKPRRIR